MKGLFKTVLFSVIFILFFFIFFELGVRVYYSFNDDSKKSNLSESVYTEVPFLNLRMLPDINFNENKDIFKFFLTPFNTNSHGFRGKDYSVLKKEGIFRIVCIGASTTFGHGASLDNATYPAFLEAKLNKNSSSGKFQVINVGIPGYSALQELILFNAQLLDLNPDMIIIYSGWNDVSTMFHLNASNYEKLFVGSDNYFQERLTKKDKYFTKSRWAVLRQIGRWRYKIDKKKRIINVGYKQALGKEERRQLMIKDIKKYSENDYYFNRPMRIYFNSVDSVITLAQKRGIKVALLTLPEIIKENSPDDFFVEFKKRFPDSVSLEKGDFYTQMRFCVQDKFNTMIRGLAASNNCILVDLDKAFPRNKNIFDLFYDEAHFTDKGNDFTADLILKEIQAKLIN